MDEGERMNGRDSVTKQRAYRERREKEEIKKEAKGKMLKDMQSKKMK